MTEFRSVRGNKKWKLIDKSYRETAMWETKDINAAQALADYIDTKYVQPLLSEVLKRNKIIGCKFLKKGGVDFKYEK